MARSSAVVAVVLVLIEVGTAVVVNLATDGRAGWLWPVLAVLVAVTCALVWWQQARGGAGTPSTRLRTKATGRGALVEDSPIDAPVRGDVDMSIKASWGGIVRRSGQTGRR